MKKYITPAFVVVTVEAESMLANSVGMNSSTTVDSQDQQGTQRKNINPIWGE